MLCQNSSVTRSTESRFPCLDPRSKRSQHKTNEILMHSKSSLIQLLVYDVITSLANSFRLVCYFIAIRALRLDSEYDDIKISLKPTIVLINTARFQITVLVRSGSVWFWLVTVLLIVCPRSLLLCPFHKKLRIRWKRSFGFCQTDNPRSSFMMYCYSTDLNIYT